MRRLIQVGLGAAFALTVVWASAFAGEAPLLALKRLPLTSDGKVYLSLGGELRERFEYYSEPFFGLRGVEQDRYVLHRLLFDADLHAGDHVRIFLQLGNYLEVGKEAGRAPTDVDELDFQQAFVDFTIPFDTRGTLMLRAGRQEMTYGSGRLVSVREGANIRRSFDGGRLTLAAGEATINAFVVRPVNVKVGVMNDDSDRQEAFWGVYGVLPWRALPDGHADIYYLGLNRADADFAQGVATERRSSFGTRLWGSPGAWCQFAGKTSQ